MRNDGFDTLEIVVCAGLRAGEDAGGIEDIEAFVFHRAHVEVINRDDIEDIKVVFAAIYLFIPCHRRFERFHAKGAFVLIAFAHPDVQLNIAA